MQWSPCPSNPWDEARYNASLLCTKTLPSAPPKGISPDIFERKGIEHRILVCCVLLDTDCVG